MKKTDTLGIVVFYEPDYKTNTIKEIGRTITMDIWLALDVYANTPNPASQIITFNTKEEQEEQEALLQKNIVDPEWLSELFECI